MLVAVLSDIHANAPAFEAVLADAATLGVEEHWCLGDVVGYGAEPDRCVELAAEHCDVLLAGNHDLAATGELSVDDFSLRARVSALWTSTVMTERSREVLSGRPSEGERADVALYHGSPRHPVWEYVISEALAEVCLDAAARRISMVGHSHLAGAYWRIEGRRATGSPRRAGESVDAASGEWLVNPGSIGQPRDGDPRASWLTIDTSTWELCWRRSDYDVAGAQAAIREAGLPESLALRLQYGQ